MQNLKTKRKELGLTQAEMARHLGITQTAYGKYELGKRFPRIQILRKMSKFFGCSIDELTE